MVSTQLCNPAIVVRDRHESAVLYKKSRWPKYFWKLQSIYILNTFTCWYRAFLQWQGPPHEHTIRSLFPFLQSVWVVSREDLTNVKHKINFAAVPNGRDCWNVFHWLTASHYLFMFFLLEPPVLHYYVVSGQWTCSLVFSRQFGVNKAVLVASCLDVAE